MIGLGSREINFLMRGIHVAAEDHALAIGAHPLLLMVPATLSASCAFMLPVATPPNAIVFGSGEVEMRHMIRTGTVLNLLGVLLVTLCFYFVSSRILGLDLTEVPDWAMR